MPKRMDTYVTIIGRAEGNSEGGFRITYYSDGRRFASKEEAVRRGFEQAESDDFNIGVVSGGKLVSLWWMDDRIDLKPESLADVGRDIGLVAARA